MEEVVKELILLVKEQNQQIIELAKLASNQPAWAPPVLEASRVPLFMGEAEEDAEHLYKTGQINKETYEDLLKEAGFYSTEMVVPVPG